MATTAAKPGSIGVVENPAGAVGRQLGGKNCLVGAPTGARRVKTDWEAEEQREPLDRAGKARRTL